MATRSASANDETPLQQPTPDPEKIDLETAKRTTKETPVDVVGNYPARPYDEAITDEHRAYLADNGIQVGTDE